MGIEGIANLFPPEDGEYLSADMTEKLREQISEDLMVPLTVYMDNQRFVIGTATVNKDGSLKAYVTDETWKSRINEGVIQGISLGSEID